MSIDQNRLRNEALSAVLRFAVCGKVWNYRWQLGTREQLSSSSSKAVVAESKKLIYRFSFSFLHIKMRCALCTVLQRSGTLLLLLVKRKWCYIILFPSLIIILPYKLCNLMLAAFSYFFSLFSSHSRSLLLRLMWISFCAPNCNSALSMPLTHFGIWRHISYFSPTSLLFSSFILYILEWFSQG